MVFKFPIPIFSHWKLLQLNCSSIHCAACFPSVDMEDWEPTADIPCSRVTWRMHQSWVSLSFLLPPIQNFFSQLLFQSNFYPIHHASRPPSVNQGNKVPPSPSSCSCCIEKMAMVSFSLVIFSFQTFSHSMQQTSFVIVNGKVIVIIFHSWLFENLEQLVTLSGTVCKTEGICWLNHDCVSITWIALSQKQKIMWLYPSLCRKHIIRHLPRFWHLPSQVGNTCIVHILESSQELCLFPWCYCGDTLLGVQKPTVLDFQMLSEMSQLWWLSSLLFL